MAQPLIHEILEFALDLCREAGELILRYWKNVTVEHKADGSEVTEADRQAERLLRQRIAERYPEHAILGEEFGGSRAKNAEHLWLVDPIDGTASFAIGLPLFGTLIGYLQGGKPAVGVIGAHALGETIYAAAGHGCWRQSDGDGDGPCRIHTSAVEDVSQAFVVSTAIERTDLDPGTSEFASPAFASLSASSAVPMVRGLRQLRASMPGPYRCRSRPAHEPLGYRSARAVRPGSWRRAEFRRRQPGSRLAGSPDRLGESTVTRKSVGGASRVGA